jgi:hypothetical protein
MRVTLEFEDLRIELRIWGLEDFELRILDVFKIFAVRARSAISENLKIPTSSIF